MSDLSFQAPGDDEPLIDDDPIDDEIDQEIASDEAPNATDEERTVCDHCDKSWTGPMRNTYLKTHLKFNHKDEQEHVHEKPKERQKPGPKPKSDSSPRGAGARALREVHDNVEFFYNMAGGILSMKDQVCGGAMKQSAKPAADAWVELAKTNAVARRFWAGGAAATGWLQLAMAHMPIALSINAHHVAPKLQARQQAYEDAMMESDESIEDLAGHPVVYHTEEVVDLPEGAFIPEGAGPGFTTSDLGYDVGENGFTETAFR